MNISVVILTLNEEINLQGCLDSVKVSDDIVIFDSFSEDKTVEIASLAGARVVKRKFDNYAAQRNAALHDVAYTHDWLLMLDADERVTPELLDEIDRVVQNPKQGVTLFRVRRKDYFFGKWLRRSSGYPTWFGRLFRSGQVTVAREINEEYLTDGEVGFLKEHLIHFPFNRGMCYWFERHNRYSSMEAKTLRAEVGRAFSFGAFVTGFLSGDPAVRRKTLKNFVYRLPLRPLVIFVYLYFIRLGFLDGRPGFRFCILRSIYEYMINIKLIEISEDHK